MKNIIRLPDSKKRSAVKGLTCTLLSALAWGSSFPVIKWGLGFLNPLVFLFLRFLTASLILIPFSLRERALDFRRLLGNRYVVLISVLNAAGYFLEFTGLSYTTASKASLLVNLNVVLVALFAAPILGECLTKRRILALTIGLTGALTVILNGDLSIMFSGSLIGDLMVLAAGVVWALYIVYSKRVVDLNNSESSVNLFDLTLVTVAFTAFLFTPAALGFMISDSSYLIGLLRGESVFGILYLSLVCTILAFILYFKGLQYIPATSVAVVLLSEILFAVLISYIFLSEPVTLWLLIGGFLIGVAVLLV